jgi:hypothetical protein
LTICAKVYAEAQQGAGALNWVVPLESESSRRIEVELLIISGLLLLSKQWIINK